jgi:hypothetical protein
VAATERKPGGLRLALAAACGVLGVAGAPAHATEVSTGALVYAEPGRVKAFELLADGTHEFANGNLGTFRLVFDALTGASANGAVPAKTAQTFTSPSGGSGYTTAAGETPLDTTFQDKRYAGSGGLTVPWGRLTKATVGVYGSFESDYTSLGVNGALSRDLFQRNTTITVRGSHFADSVSPMGGAPVPFAEMPAPTPGEHDDKAALEDDDEGSSESKGVTDVGLGVTQILTRRTLLALNYTNTRVTGYQTDPYKLLSVVDADGRPVAGVGTPELFRYESRPDSRAKRVAAAELIQNLGRDILTLSYRYYDDDWGITSRTTEVSYRLNFKPDHYLQPNLRWYHQSAADFYRRYLMQGDALPDYASADYRLGDMRAVSTGLKYGTKLKNGNDLTLRLEYYKQTGDHAPADAVGDLRDLDLFPTVDAWIANVGMTFGKH